MEKRRNVYEATLSRLDKIFSDFDNIYVSFSGGKDSGVLLNLCINYIRQHKLKRRIGVFHMDYEVQYSATLQYVEKVFSRNTDILDIYRVCVPFKVPTCTSMYQNYWRPWNEKEKNLWVREMPRSAFRKEDFDFFSEEDWDYDFQMKFSEWIHRYKRARRTCCLVGIRTQESFNRWRTIHSDKNYCCYQRLKWTRKITDNVYNAYPIYDWRTTDIWVANGRFKWDYNHLYDLYYQAGVKLEKQRVASPFISAAIPSLQLYRVIDPQMWGRMINRVNGVNFANLYGSTGAMGWYTIKCPPHMTWEKYMHFLLNTLPEDIKKNYLEKLRVSIEFWRNRGGVLSDNTIEKLRKMGIQIAVGETTNYKTTKKPVRMEYLDDIDIEEFRELPTFKRMCICILKNDHSCKYMGFAPTKVERERRDRIMEKYKKLYEEDGQ
ncbi:MAG: DUF3440 domain-containing protein [Porphyromonadaceae bacterium]|nr:DUF3440 domain-containing protein [Porphyromonadaceae bacterium]